MLNAIMSFHNNLIGLLYKIMIHHYKFINPMHITIRINLDYKFAVLGASFLFHAYKDAHTLTTNADVNS